MRKPTVEEEYTGWQEIYNFAVQNRHGIERNWRRWYNIVDDNLWAGAHNKDGSEPVEVNELGSIIEAIIPNIILYPGKVEIRAIHQDDVYRAVIYEYIAKYILTHYNIKQQFIQSVYDTLVLGDSLIKVGYWLLPLVQDAQWRAGLASSTTESAFALHTPLFEFYPDYHVKSWSLQRFFIHEVYKHIDEFKDNNSMYDQRQVDKLKPNATERDAYSLDSSNLSKKVEYVKVQEIHDLTSERIIITSFQNGAESPLLVSSEPYPLIPFEHLSFFPRPMNLWGTSISQRIEQHLVSLSRMHSGLDSVLRKLAVFKVMFDSTKIKKESIALLKEAGDSVIPVIGTPSDVIENIDLGISNKQFIFDQGINLKLSTIRSSSGVTQQQLGVAETGVDTAFEVNTLKSASDIKNKMRLQIFESFATRVIEKLLYIVSVEYSADRISQMTGIDPSIIEGLMVPYEPGKYLVQYGDSAANANNERLQKLMMLMNSPFVSVLNPEKALQMFMDAIDLEYEDEMVIPGATMNGIASLQGKLGVGKTQQQKLPQGVSTPGNRQNSNVMNIRGGGQ